MSHVTPNCRPSPTLASHVMEDLCGRIPLVLDGGPCGCGVESTVLDGLRQPPVLLRPGGVTYERLSKVPGLERLQVGSFGNGPHTQCPELPSPCLQELLTGQSVDFNPVAITTLNKALLTICIPDTAAQRDSIS